MLNAEITIERSPEIVWAYFIEPENWEKWWLGRLKEAQWSQGGKLVWESGGFSLIEAITPGRKVEISEATKSVIRLSTTFIFEPMGSGKTTVRIQDCLVFGNVLTGDGGPSRLAQLNSSLTKLNEHIIFLENETSAIQKDNQEQATGLQPEVLYLGTVFSKPKRGRIVDAGKTFAYIVESDEQVERLQTLWPSIAESIVNRANEGFWNTIGWKYSNGMEGLIQGIVLHFKNNTPIYLMEFSHKDECVYCLIGQDGVEIID